MVTTDVIFVSEILPGGGAVSYISKDKIIGCNKIRKSHLHVLMHFNQFTPYIVQFEMK